MDRAPFRIIFRFLLYRLTEFRLLVFMMLLVALWVLLEAAAAAQALPVPL